MKLIETTMLAQAIALTTFYAKSFVLNGKPCELRDTADQSKTYLLYADWYDHSEYDVIKVYEVVDENGN